MKQEFLKAKFGSDWQFVAKLLAATSARVQLATSYVWTMNIYQDVKAGRKPDLHLLLKCHRLNVMRTINGEPLQGDKVRRFYQNLIGNYEPVTIDTWMLKLFKWWRKQPTPSMRQYERMERAFQKWSKGRQPAEMQAILWVEYRKKQGRSPVGYERCDFDMRVLI